MLRSTTLVRVPLAAAAVVALVGCGDPAPRDPGPDGATPSVAISFFPIADAARAIAGDAVEIVDLTPPGVSPHDLEITPRQRAALDDAETVVYLGSGFQPQVEQVAESLGDDVSTVNLLDAVQLLPVRPGLTGVTGEVDGEVLPGDLDPHAWVAPRMFAVMVEELAATLSALVPDSAADLAAARDDYLAELAALDAEFSAGLASCESTVIVTSHRAFEYLARDYGLTQISIAGISPDEEPDPRTLEAVANAARAERVGTVFFEDTLPPDLSDTVAREIGADTDLLSPIETIEQADLDAGASYLSIQRDNLDRLVRGLRCR